MEHLGPEERNTMMTTNFEMPPYCPHSHEGHNNIVLTIGEGERIVNRGGGVLFLVIRSHLVDRNTKGLPRDEFIKGLEPSGEGLV